MQVTFYGKNRHFYDYDGEFYTATFPALWAEKHLPGTGPKECGDCKKYGSWNGVFIGYCANCAIHEYKATRGFGIRWGEEYTESMVEIPIQQKRGDDWVRAFDTYLYGICLDDIGDENMCESRILVEEAFKADVLWLYNNNCYRYPADQCLRVFINKEKINDHDYEEDDNYDAEDDEYTLLETDVDDDFDDYEFGMGYGYGSNYNGGYDSF